MTVQGLINFYTDYFDSKLGKNNIEVTIDSTSITIVIPVKSSNESKSIYSKLADTENQNSIIGSLISTDRHLTGCSLQESPTNITLTLSHKYEL